MGPPSFGGDITRSQFAKLTFALCIGTLVEWYDFSVYTQLSNTITAAFFPPKNPVAAELSFWAVYAVGFIARPLGAVIFGHVGDSYGRRLTLLMSVLGVTLPTLLIGCLPTYAHIGLAAPSLMAVLRFLQGLAVGGEFGSAITYLYELAPAGRKGTTASLGQMAVSPGMILGILVCQVVLYACSPAQLSLWGWRVPFLITVFTSPLALYLRMHMPEPYEYLENRQQMVLQRVASTAANKVAHSFTRHQYDAGGSVSTINSQFLVGLSAIRLSSLSSTFSTIAARQASERDVFQRHHSSSRGAAAAAGGGGIPAGRQLSSRQLSLQLQRSVSISADGKLVPDATRQQQVHGNGKDVQPISPVSPVSPVSPASPTATPLGCEREFHKEVENLSGVIKHHVPLAVLFKDHWQGVSLQFLLEACYGSTFYTVFTWVPNYAARVLHVSTSNTLWALLIGLVLFAAACVLTGRYLCDTNVPKIWALLAAVGVCAVAVMPVLAVLQSGFPLGLWLLVPMLLGVAGIIGGLMTTIGPQIYPPAVRTSGYNLGHNLTMSVFGGLCPLIISALAVVLQPATNAAGVVVILSALVSFAAGVALIKVVPGANAACPAGAHVAYLQQQEQRRTEGMQMQEVVVRNNDD